MGYKAMDYNLLDEQTLLKLLEEKRKLLENTIERKLQRKKRQQKANMYSPGEKQDYEHILRISEELDVLIVCYQKLKQKTKWDNPRKSLSKEGR